MALRGPAFDLGGRILNLARELGLEAIDVTGAVHVWTRWNPDTEIAPPGLFPIRTIVDQLVELGYLDDDMAERIALLESRGQSVQPVVQGSVEHGWGVKKLGA